MDIKQIACCTDFSENAEAAFQMSIEMAEKYHASLTIIHVLPPQVNPMMNDSDWMVPELSTEAITLRLEERMQDEYGTKVPEGVDYRTAILDGHVSSEIIKYLETHRIDLVVLGAYGLSGMELVLFGSVAKRVVHKAPCSVLIARKRVEPK